MTSGFESFNGDQFILVINSVNKKQVRVYQKRSGIYWYILGLFLYRLQGIYKCQNQARKKERQPTEAMKEVEKLVS